MRDKLGDLLDNSVRENVRRIATLLETSEALNRCCSSRSLPVRCGSWARDDLDTGEVEFFA